MSRFLAPRYQKLDVYTPGEQPTDKRYIKLNTNESPFPPSEGVIKALSSNEVADLRLYSDPTAIALRLAIAEQFELAPEEIFISNGSDDILNFSFMAFCDGAKCGVTYPEISYGFYPVYAALHGVDARAVPLNSDFSISPEDYFGNDRTVVIANPNAPTGMALSQREMECIIRANPDRVVVVDEAYVDFGAESCVGLVPKYPNLLVVRTFSKSYSLAGARLGFAVGSRELIADLERIKYSTNPYNVNRLSMLAGTVAFHENEYYMRNCRIIMKNRDFLTRELRAMGFEVLDSKANFIFAQSPDIDGEELYLALKERGILVRHFTKESIKNYNRITIGTMQDMKTLVKTVRAILEEKHEKE